MTESADTNEKLRELQELVDRVSQQRELEASSSGSVRRALDVIRDREAFILRKMTGSDPVQASF